jgi:hypothetical protein
MPPSDLFVPRADGSMPTASVPSITSEALQNFAEDRFITGARHTLFGAGRDHHLGETSQRAT